MNTISPVEAFIKKKGVVILDGGLATELEKMGHDLNSDLWSAKLLKSDSEEIYKVHMSYLNAGSDCITTASYQASLEGFIACGYSLEEGKDLLIRSVELAERAIYDYMENKNGKAKNILKPLIAASIGPYGAYLANGEEYIGNYKISKQSLYAFHLKRWEILADLDIDLFAIETIPSLPEAEIILNLIKKTPGINAWISFSCKDGKHISDGTPIKDSIRLFKNCKSVIAVGVNCTQPKYIPSLINEIHSEVPKKHIIVYPNSGEFYDGKTKKWFGTADPGNYKLLADQWFKMGATLIGGCCKTGPEHIHAIRNLHK